MPHDPERNAPARANPVRIQERVFIAVWLPTRAATSMRDQVRPLLNTEAGALQVTPDRYHVTLRFIGDVDVDRIARLRVELGRRMSGHRPFELSISGAGHFEAAKVAWAGLAPSPRLRQLERSVSAVVEEMIPAVGSRRGEFRPHLTLARHVPVDPHLIGLLADRCRTEPFPVTSVELVSHPPGDTYRRIASIPLGSEYT